MHQLAQRECAQRTEGRERKDGAFPRLNRCCFLIGSSVSVSDDCKTAAVFAKAAAAMPHIYA
jgi:hypothetical protein